MEDKLGELINSNAKKEYATLICLFNNADYLLETDLDIDCFNNPLSRNLFQMLIAYKYKYLSGEISSLVIDPLKAKEIADAAKLNITDEDIIECKEAAESPWLDMDNFAAYSEDLKSFKNRVKLINTARRIIEAGCDLDKNVSLLIENSSNQIGKIEENVSNIDEPHILCLSNDIVGDMRSAPATKTAGLQTGFPTLDNAIDGLQKKSLTVIGARAKVGKSALGLNIELNIAEKYGLECPILQIDTEMDTQHQYNRALSILSQVDAQKIRRRNLDSDEMDRLEEANKKLAAYPIYHIYMPNFTIDGIESLVRRMKNKKGIGLVIYDYIKMPDGESTDRSMQEYQVLGRLTNTLKNKIAGKLDIPVLTFGQLNRDGVKQAVSGEVDETSISGSDRIIHYCSSYCVFRRTSEQEIKYQPNPQDPEWKKFGKYANRMIHIIATRDGGDSADPIPVYYNDNVLTMKESKDAVNDISDS